jgi:hypothetical protein
VFRAFDLVLVAAALIASAMYIAESYSYKSFKAVQVYKTTDAIVSIIFTVDYVLNLFISKNPVKYVLSPVSILDAVTFLPFYLEQAAAFSKSINLGILRFIKILRLLRFARVFKLLKHVSGATRQVFMIALTMLTVIFLGAGVIQIMENDVKKAMESACDYCNAATHYRPSCCVDLPYNACSAVSACDCKDSNCHSRYNYRDKEHQPTGIACETLTFFRASYFVVVTVATVGECGCRSRASRSRNKSRSSIGHRSTLF